MASKFSSFDPTRRQMIRSMVAGSALLPAILQQCLAVYAQGGSVWIQGPAC